MKKLSALFLTLALMVGAQANAKPVVGADAPDFSTTDINGKSVALKDLKDKIVVLEWHNPECPFVKKQYDSNNMQQLQKKYADKNVVWVSINSGAEGKQGHLTTDDAKKLVADKGFNANHYVIDDTGTLGKLYGATTTPHMFIIDKGTLVYQGAIDSISSADKTDIEKAENYVVRAIDEILAGKPVSTSVTTQYGCGVKYAD